MPACRSVLTSPLLGLVPPLYAYEADQRDKRSLTTGGCNNYPASSCEERGLNVRQLTDTKFLPT